MNSSPFPFKSEFLNLLQERGFLYQCSSYEGLDTLMSKQKISAYIGFDCTANSLHIGSLIQIMLLRYLQKTGHTPIAVLGGGTTLVGDPSGKDESRKMLTSQDINDNMLGIKGVLEKFITFSGSNPALMLNNAEWLTKFYYLDFLRDYGTEFTINRMLAFDSVKLRLEKENPLTFLEFNYMLLQAVDYLYLNKNHDCSLQLGGSDQWGNIINGVELIRRVNQKEVFALTTPLLTKADGSKMGKTAGGAVWLSKDLFSPWDFFQFFRNTDDLDTIKFLKLFTELPLFEIEKLAKLQGQEINEAKKILAFEITKIVHGVQHALECQQTAINTFEKHSLDENLPTFYLRETQLSKLNIIQLITQFGFAPSSSEARRLMQGGAVKVNDIIINDYNYVISKKNIVVGSMKISIGKKKHYLVKLAH